MAHDSTGHGHGHGHVRRRWWHHLKHAVTPHGHDSADRFDSALETSRRGVRTLVWSFAALLVTAIAQLVLVLHTHSVALLGDTIHNFADALTALPVGIAFLLGRRVATRRYTYGLGRAEDLAGVVVVLIIAASATFAGYEAVLRLVEPRPVQHLWVVAAAGLIGFAGNEIVARWRIAVGRRIGSAALVADGLHARTDGFTSLAVVLGAAGVALGFPLADPIIGLAITAAILFVLRDAAKQVLHRLMDAVDPRTVDLAEQAAAGVAGVRGVDRVRMRWIGHSLHAELAVAVDPALTVERAHLLAHDVEHALVHRVPRLTAAVVHTEPATGADSAHALLAHHGR
ncbi:cation diffusion facilitator family transporter [Saccharopolyspora sp. TS4A08]|uniref:Cation diffusion facilitator family transporter n=1 Tax=Saccharopolyspora ipomoeae TaxID=3042027 RepID=A0ABT6PRX8_9PSEU|nr:cation diffusion facilitator family transporter [Saccharopolyspora sp. TS4A08]MDI2030398.1 cation diffusion facilitator family transporter [Saccharopolyspora sp. TS4A08]